jgi:hypothetical protein
MELSADSLIDARQLQIIINHANLVHATEGLLDADIQEFIAAR